MKKTVSALLALLLCFLLAAPAFAADVVARGICGKHGGNVTWTLDSAGTLTISGTGEMADYDYYGVPWSSNRENIRRVEIQSGVTSIGELAFTGCSSLTSVSIPVGVTSIGISAFNGCVRLTSVNIPEGVTSIGEQAFEYCWSLTSVSIPEGVTSIGKAAFEDCSSLTSISIPEGVTSIGNWAFWKCSSLTSVIIPASVTDIGTQAFASCSSLTSVSIPESVTSIGYYAFEYCRSLTSVSISEGVTSIGGCAFAYCSSLTSVRIPESVTSIGGGAFDGCSSLTSVRIPESVTSIGYGAFAGCSKLADISVASGSSNYKDIDGVLFSKDTTTLHSFPAGRKVEAYIIPESVTSIGRSAFADCSSLTSVRIPESVTSIGEYAFEYCSSLTGVSIPEGVTSIASHAFRGCGSLKSVTLPSNITVISIELFSGCSSLTSVTIPERVQGIGTGAFEECGSLTEVIIPKDVAYIRIGAFYGCSSLTDVYYGGTEAQWSAIEIDDYNTPLTSATIHYNSSGDTKSLNSAAVTVPRASYPYSGKAIKPNVTVKLNGERLTKNADYTVQYSNNKEVGTATVTVTGKGEYTGTATTTFEIVSTTKALDSAVVSVPKPSYNYTGKALKPVVTVTLNGEKLRKNTDYTVAYKNNTKVGTATVTVTGKGNYTGTASTTFEIVSTTKPINSAVVTVPKASYDYSGKAIKPVVTVKLDGKRLRKNTDYTVTYKNNTEVGTATVTITGKGDYTGTVSTTFEIVSKTKPLDGATVTGVRKSYTYTGKAIKPAVTVKLDGQRLRKNTDYTVTYKNNTKVGTATITITGKGDYTGTVQTTFLIIEK